MNNFDIREVNLSDVKKVDENYLSNETCAKARELFINEFGPVEMMVLTPSFELLLHPEIYDALVASGVEKTEAVIVTTPEDANQHVRNLFGNVPSSATGKAAWLESSQPYYKKGGAGYFLRMDDTKGDDDKSLKAYLGSFIGLSHASVQKLLDISRSDCGAALLHNIDEGKCSIDRAYKICKSDTTDEKVVESLKDHACVNVLGGNTKEYRLPDEEKSRIAQLFAGVTKEVSTQLSLPEIPAAFNLRPNLDRKGKLESYSFTYKAPEGNFTGIYQPKEKEVKHGTE